MQRLNPQVLGKVVVASIYHREKWTTTTKSTKWPVHLLTPTPICSRTAGLSVEPWLTTFTYTHIGKQHWSIIIRPMILKFILLLRSDVSTWTFSQSYIHTYTPTQPLYFNSKNEVTLLYSFKPLHTMAIYVSTLILLWSVRIYCYQRWTRPKVFEKSHKRRIKSDLWLSYNSLKKQNVFPPNWQIPSSKLHTKVMFIQRKRKGQRKPQHQNLYFHSDTK